MWADSNPPAPSGMAPRGLLHTCTKAGLTMALKQACTAAHSPAQNPTGETTLIQCSTHQVSVIYIPPFLQGVHSALHSTFPIPVFTTLWSRLGWKTGIGFKVNKTASWQTRLGTRSLSTRRKIKPRNEAISRGRETQTFCISLERVLQFTLDILWLLPHNNWGTSLPNHQSLLNHLLT